MLAAVTVILAASVIPNIATAQLEQIYQENLRGGVVMTGNTLGRSGLSTAWTDAPGTRGSAFTWINDRTPATEDNAAWEILQPATGPKITPMRSSTSRARQRRVHG